MKSQVDVVVVGAGPAGSAAALRAAQAGFEVLLVEKRQEIGVPVRCGEATDIDSTRQFIALDPRWITNHIEKYVIASSTGERVVVPPSGDTIILDRKVFDPALAQEAARAGAEVRVSTTATGLLREGKQITGVRLKSMGKEYTVSSRLVIAADGTESQLARWAGLRTIPPMADFYVGLQYTLAGMRPYIQRTHCEYHVGMETIAPGGYIWVFPKSDDTANVGVVISANYARERSAHEWLDRFVEQRFPGTSLLNVMAGGIPITGALKTMVTDGLLVVGDAAHMADPLTAGGIGLGMIGAGMAVEAAAPAIRAGNVTARQLKQYEVLWHERFGRMHAALLAVRRILTRMAESQFNDMVRTAASLPLDSMTPGKILLALLQNQPALLLEARTLITTGLLLK